MKAFLLILDMFSWLFGVGRPHARIEAFIVLDATALSGERTKIGFIPFVYPDCKSYGDVKFDLIAKPEHGVIFLTEDDEILPTDIADGPRPDCGDKPVHGLKVEYLPEPRYAGDDWARYSIRNQRGEIWKYEHVIGVMRALSR